MPGEGQKSFTLRLPDELHAQMAAAAESDHISLNSAIIQAARLWLDDGEPQPSTGTSAPATEGLAPVPVAMVGMAIEKMGHVLAALVEDYELEPEVRESSATALEEVAESARRLRCSSAVLWPG